MSNPGAAEDFLANAAVALHYVAADGTILWANQAELKLLGYEPHEYIGHNIREFHADPPVIAEILDRLAEGQELHDWEARLRARDGSIRHVAITSNVHWENGRFLHTRCFTRDITDQKRATELQERLAAIIESSNDAIIGKDLPGMIRSWNAGAEKMFGYTAAEVIGNPVSILAVPDRIDEMPDLLARVSRGERIDHYETLRRAKSGRILTISLTVSPIRDARGTVIGASEIARDITERKEAEQRQQEMHRELTLLIEASGALLASPRLDEVLRRIMATAAQCIAADAYAVWRKQPDGLNWKLITSRGLSDGYNQTTSGNAQSLLSGPIVVEDVYSVPLLRDRAALYEAEGIRSILAVPLRIHGDIGGTIVLYYRSPHRFAESEVRLASALGNLAAAAIGTAELYGREIESRAQAERAQQQAAFLAEAGALLSSSLDYDTTLRRVAEAAVPGFADWCAVDMLGKSGELRRLAVAHQDPAKVNFAREMHRKYPRRESDPISAVLRTHESVLIEDITPEMIIAGATSPEHLEDLRRLDIRSAIVVPMVARDIALGTITFVNSESERRYSAADLRVAEELASRAATAVENARLHAEVRDSEERLRLAQSAAGIGNWEWDLNSDAVRWSPEIFKLLGAGADDLQPSFATWLEHVHAEDRERVMSEARAAVESGQMIDTEFRIVRRDGQVRWVLSRARVFRDLAGQSARLLGLNMDVTPQKTIEERTAFLLHVEDSIRTLSEAAEITRTAAQLLGRYLRVNRCAYAHLEADQRTFHLTGNYTDGLPSIVGRYAIQDFGAEFARLSIQGEPYVVTDSESDPRTADVRQAYRAAGIRAVISVPIHKSGRFVAGMAVHQSVPRAWTDDDIELVQQVASRCWESIERARIQRELRESEARFRVMADSSPVMIWIAGPGRACTWFNRPWLEFTGRTAEAEYGLGWTENVHPDDLNRCLQVYDQAYYGGDPFQVEYRLRRSDGEYRWVLDHGAPLFADDGTFSGYIGSSIDISARIAAEAAVRESEAQFRQLADTIPAFVWVTEADGTLTYFNVRWYEYSGLTPEQSLGAGWTRTLHPDDADRVLAVWTEARAAQQPYAVECRYRGADGAYRWYMARALPVREADGAIVRWFGTSTDIESAKRTEEQLRKANAELEEFAYVASHDLQEPLRMVNIYTELLLRKTPVAADARQYAEVITSSVRRMGQLIEDLLDYSRTIHADGQPLGRADLSASLQEAISTLRNVIADTGAVIRCEALPLVCGDTHQLALVFQNLLSNALKYRKAGVTPEIVVSSRVSNGRATVSVRDNGIGFDPRYAAQIFGLFKRLFKDEYPGTGLGLAICRRVVERFGGRIWAESRRGEGSTFLFTLTLAETHESSEQSPMLR